MQTNDITQDHQNSDPLISPKSVEGDSLENSDFNTNEEGNEALSRDLSSQSRIDGALLVPGSITHTENDSEQATPGLLETQYPSEDGNTLIAQCNLPTTYSPHFIQEASTLVSAELIHLMPLMYSTTP